MFKNLKNAFATIQETVYKVTTTASGKETIHQTQRNELGRMLLQALYADLAEEFPETDNPNAVIVRVTEDGAVFEIPNASIRDTILNKEGSGAISVALDTEVKGLEYNAEYLATYYAEKVAEKAQKKAKQAEEKARKIERDKARREAQKAKKAET